MNNAIMQLVQMVNGGGNPMGILAQAAMQNPQMAQAMQMINGKNEGQLKQMAENMAKERGIDISTLAQSLGIRLPN